MVRMLNFDDTQQQGKVIGVFIDHNYKRRQRVISTRTLICFVDRLMGVRKVKVNVSSIM